MIDDLRILAIVPARGGSKGVPRKNLRVVGGLPLIGWTISAAKNSLYIDQTVLSSDDEEICEAARGCGADVVLKRPSELATDKATSFAVVEHVLDVIPGFDVGILLQPTSPLRIADDIDDCLMKLVRRGAESCVSISESAESPYWMYRMDADERLVPLLNADHGFTRRQDIPVTYLPNGALYAFRTPWLRKSRCFVDGKTLGHVMPYERSLDIDTEQDMAAFEAIVDSRK